MNISGWFNIAQNSGRLMIYESYGAFTNSAPTPGYNLGQSQNAGANFFQSVWFNANRSWTGLTSSAKTSDDKPTGIYGNSATVQPPALKFRVKTRFK